jgi:hypothetical protein
MSKFNTSLILKVTTLNDFKINSERSENKTTSLGIRGDTAVS